MHTEIYRRRILPLKLSAIALAIAVAAGCAPLLQQGVHVDRVTLYPNVASLAKDSSEIIVATVRSQRVVNDIPDDPTFSYTITSADVVEVVDTQKQLAIGDLVEVRQVGTNTSPTPVPLMTKGTTYLIYLTLSGLSGDRASQYYITGSNAGLYVAAGNDEFKQVMKEDGEGLPATIKLANAKG